MSPCLMTSCIFDPGDDYWDPSVYACSPNEAENKISDAWLATYTPNAYEEFQQGTDRPRWDVDSVPFTWEMPCS